MGNAIKKVLGGVISILILVACEPANDSSSDIYSSLCSDSIAEAREHVSKKAYQRAEITLSAAEEVFGCDTLEFKNLVADVAFASIGGSLKSGINTPSTSPRGVTSQTSNMTDEKSVYISTRSEPYRGDYAMKQAELTVRCQENTTSVIWNWAEYLGDDDSDVYRDRKRMTLRLDSENPKESWFSVSTNNEAVGLWSGGDAIPFIRDMVKAERLVARIVPYGDNPREAVFDISKLNEHLPELQQACNWK